MVINYAEHNDHATNTLIFLHGNSHSHKSFTKQAASDALKDFRLVLLDLPGHGDSSHLTDEYSLPSIAELVAEFISLKNIENYILIGHSFGGHITIHSLQYLNPLGLVIFGTPPISRPFELGSFLPHPGFIPLTKGTSNLEELQMLTDVLNYEGVHKETFLEDYYRADSRFRETIFLGISKMNYFDEVQLLKNYKGKAHVILSNHETIINNEYIRRVIKKIDFTYMDCSHSPQTERTEEFNLLIRNFAQGVFGTK